MRALILLLALVTSASAADPGDKTIDAAAAFGARPDVSTISLSPDGATVAYITPSVGQGADLYTMQTAADAKPRLAMSSAGNPYRLQRCQWVSNTRLVCTLFWVGKVNLEPAMFSRLIAVDSDGGHPTPLGSGHIIDLLPDEQDAVLVEGFGVARFDTLTGKATRVVGSDGRKFTYITDGRGNVRIYGVPVAPSTTKQLKGIIKYMYCMAGSSDWHPLSEFHDADRSGFVPVAVDPQLDVAYGFKKKDGRLALYKIALDGSLREELVYERPDVDLNSVIAIGPRHSIVGVRYTTDRPQAFYFDPVIKAINDSLVRALPNKPILGILDESMNEGKLLVFAGSDNDPGSYYLFDRNTHEMTPLLKSREALTNVTLASVKPIQYPATDGTLIPAYLTLPPGRETARGLPAIVMPHGGPSDRDSWGFNWIAQFFAARGFAVLQPNYRGSAGYGDAWFEQNGFRSWPTAIGDVLDGGRWLVAQGIAETSKVAIVGWSYGGYAALQSAAVDPAVFKAVVAIAPVTDLNALKEQYRHWTNYELMENFVGKGSNVRDGSPLQNAARIQVPVLLFHGTQDLNVRYEESDHMAAALKAANKPVELVTFRDLDHQLDDSEARAQVLRKSDAFLRETLGLL